MITTDYVNGAPVWMDLGTSDLDGAASFYKNLFGWTFLPGGPEVGGYGLFQFDGRTAAGGMTVTPEQGDPAWSVYFRTGDADATAAAVDKAGGTVVIQPMDVMDMGRMAILADSAGASFGIWQPGTSKGLDHVTEDGGLNWVELYTPDVDGAKAFYAAVFGWGTYDVQFPGGTYTSVNPADTDENGMFGGIVPLSADPAEKGEGAHWVPYVHVPDVDAAAAMTRELNGTVRAEPVSLPGVGRIAKLSDPAGAGFAVIKGDPNEK
ncbi:VOC family protein [Streptomyces sp. SID5785]|uniref:VOC family protein n=1 Tax=Streptomyces sp. SID5785 TaxID=2690309 RepID=UPI0013610E1A|nr:VOC family protein [Streptomyces sp. SID5785]MZD08499.1 VOC family protein [Streptomyces sp. SID5785]